jgi:hypothetical protein
MTTATKINLLFIPVMILAIALTAPLPAHADNPADDPPPVIYTVQPGDTLLGIALRYRLNLAEVMAANQIFYPGLIFPGQQLRLPGVVAATPTPLPSPHPNSDASPTAHRHPADSAL